MYRNTPENVNGGEQPTVHTGKIECQFSIHLLSACLLPRSIYQRGRSFSHWTNKEKKKSQIFPQNYERNRWNRSKSSNYQQVREEFTASRKAHNSHTRSRSNWPDLRWFRSHGVRVYGSQWRHSLAVSRWLTDWGKTESAERSGHYSTTRALQERARLH